MTFQSPILPAGLVKNDVEFFYEESIGVMALFGLRFTPLSQLPADLRHKMFAEIEQNTPAKKALDDMGLKTGIARIEQYVKCRHGAFDNVPDHDGKRFKATEYWDCGMRGKCAFEGKLCAPVQGANGTLTPREVQVTKHIAAGLQDKEIADVLGISENTLIVHKRNIKQKTGAQSKVDIAVFAIQKNIYAETVS